MDDDDVFFFFFLMRERGGVVVDLVQYPLHSALIRQALMYRSI